MKFLKVLGIIILLSSFQTFAQVYLDGYPNITTVEDDSEFILWQSSATKNITFDNLKNQIKDSTLTYVADSYLDMTRTLTTTTSSVNLTTSSFALIDTITTNTTYTFSSPQVGYLTLLVYSAASYSIDFSFAGGNLWAPYGLTSVTTYAGASYTEIQLMIMNSTNIIVKWQSNLTDIN